MVAGVVRVCIRIVRIPVTVTNQAVVADDLVAEPAFEGTGKRQRSKVDKDNHAIIAKENVVGSTTLDGFVIACTTEEVVIVRSTEGLVVIKITEDDVGSATTKKCVIPVVAADKVIAGFPVYCIGAIIRTGSCMESGIIGIE